MNTSRRVEWFGRDPGGTTMYVAPASATDVPVPSRADVMAALDHENFCRWQDHRDCCGVTVEDCTCNVDLNIRALERLGWLPLPATRSLQGGRARMSDTTTSRAPWTDEEVAALERWQSGPFHPFTCPNRREGHRVTTDLGVLVPTGQGWTCPDCDYTQDWAHSFMISTTAAPKLPRLIVVCGSVSDEGRLSDAALAARTIDHDLVYIPRASDGLTRAEHDREHRAWIDRADEVIAVRKPDGSVGESTAAEVEYALSRGKPVRWWPPDVIE
jgi:hypothetical protein